MRIAVIVVLVLMLSGLVYAADEVVQIPISSAQVIQGALDKATEVITKVGENRVRVQRVLKDKDGNDVVLAKQDFGTEQITKNLENLQAEKQAIQQPDYVTKTIAKIDTEIALWTKVKIAMDGAITPPTE